MAVFDPNDLTEREVYFTTLPHIPAPGRDIFEHTPPGSKPTEPDVSGLDEAELAEFEAWKADGSQTPTLPDAITAQTAYIAYQKELKAWKYADHLARETQHRWALSDASALNKATVAASSNVSGTGSGAPPNYVPPRGYHDPEP